MPHRGRGRGPDRDPRAVHAQGESLPGPGRGERGRSDPVLPDHGDGGTPIGRGPGPVSVAGIPVRHRGP